MFTRFIFVSAILVAVAAFPAISTKSKLSDAKSTWSESLSLVGIFGQIAELFPSFSEIGPNIEVDDDHTNIIVKAKNYQVKDLSVKIKEERVILKGTRNSVNSEQDLTSEFLYAVLLPKNINKKEVFATFYSDEYLVITSPSKGLSSNKNTGEIVVPIKEVPQPFKPKPVVNDPVPIHAVSDTQSGSEPIQSAPEAPVVPVPEASAVAQAVPEASLIAPVLSGAPDVPETSVVAQSVPEIQVVAQPIPEVPVSFLVAPDVSKVAESVEETTELAQSVEEATVVAQSTEETSIVPVSNQPDERKEETVTSETTSSLEEQDIERKEDSYETTERFEEITIDTTPYEANEVSDLEPVTVSYI